MSINETTLAEQLKAQGLEDVEVDDVAVLLQPLLEQEAQLEYVISFPYSSHLVSLRDDPKGETRNVEGKGE